MKLKHQVPRGRGAPGVTLIELSVIIIVLFAFIAMTFIGVRAWKRGADRAECILNIRHIQMAVRGYANTNNLAPGTDVGLMSPPVSLPNELIGPGKFLPTSPLCPANGLYATEGNNIPPLGTLYMTCSLAGSDGHEPANYRQW